MRRRLALVLALTALAGALPACGSDSSSSSCKPRAIAWLGARTGAARRPPFQNGAELAVHLYNVAHPDCPVGYISFDSQGDPDIAKRLAQTIVDDPQIIAVVGPGYSGETSKALPIFDDAGLANVTASATNPDLATQGWTVFHRVSGNDAAQGPATAAFLAQTLKVRRVASIDDGGLYAKTLADLVASSLGERGIVVAPRGSVDPKGVDYRAAVEAIAEIGVDAVYYGGVTEPGVRLLRQLRDAGSTAPFMGGDGIFDPSFITGVGIGSAGAYATCPCVDPALVDTEARKTFRANYKALFDDAPVGFAMEYFDAATLVLQAIDSGVSSRAAMDRWLDSVDVPGLTKQLSFTDNGEIRVGPIQVLQVVSGRFVQVGAVVEGRFVAG
ncbi:MAG: branched-chain amino acid ABC transporter substrate-binding protein [Ilumatobacteraceae bacterium]